MFNAKCKQHNLLVVRFARPFRLSQDISSDDSSDEEELKEEINNEDLFETDEDYDKLMALPEIEREAILSERYEKKKEELDRKKAAREQRKLEKAQKKKASGGKTVKVRNEREN